MKNKAFIFTLLLLVVIISAPVAMAKENNNGKQNKIEVNVDNDDDSSSVHIRNEVQGSAFQKVEINNNKFEIMGVISSVGTNSFAVNEQTIYVDPSQVSKFEQKGILKADEKVKVEGDVKNGKLYAKEINVIGTGQGRYKVEINGLTLATPTPTPSTSPVPTVSPSPRPSTSPAPSASASASPLPTNEPNVTPYAEPTTIFEDMQMSFKTSGPIKLVSEFFTQVSNYLKNLVR